MRHNGGNLILIYRIQYRLMLKMLEVFNGANAQFIIYNNSIESKSNDVAPKPSDEFNVEQRFKLDWNFYKGNLTDQIKQSLAVYAI